MEDDATAPSVDSPGRELSRVDSGDINDIAPSCDAGRGKPPRTRHPRQRRTGRRLFHLHAAHGVAPAATDRVVRLQQLLRSEDVTTAGQLGEALGMSPVQLKRLCIRLFGVTPKALLIRHRLARMLAALEHRPYAELRQFLDLGYCDQSHFIRDFKAFFGMPPTRYFAVIG
jgi:AraC-like DNA-binding protein